MVSGVDCTLEVFYGFLQLSVIMHIFRQKSTYMYRSRDPLSVYHVMEERRSL